VNPQGTVAFMPGDATGVAIVDGATVVVAVSPMVMPDALVSGAGTVWPPISWPSAAVKAPVATNAAPANRVARNILDRFMVTPSLFLWSGLM
jgi:hypothetical protein